MAYRIDVYEAKEAEWNSVTEVEQLSTAIARAIIESANNIIRVQDGDNYTLSMYYNFNLMYMSS